MSEPAADPRERTILLMAIGTLFLIVVMAGVSVMTLLTILFPPPIPEGAAPGPKGANAATPAEPVGGSGEAGSKGAMQGGAMQGGATQGAGTPSESAPRDRGAANEAPMVPSGPVPSSAVPSTSTPEGSVDSNSDPRL